MKFSPGKLISFDCEGTGLDVPHTDSAFALAICNTSLDHVYYEWDVDPITRAVTYPQKDMVAIRKILESPRIIKVAHNTPYDIMALEPGDVEVCEPYEDTQIKMRRAKSNEKDYKLKRLGRDFLDIDNEDEKELKDVVKRCRHIAKGLGWNIGEKVVQDYWLPRAIKKRAPIAYANKLPKYAADLCGIYCVKDAERCMMLNMLLEKKIGDKERRGYKMEMRLMPFVIEMQHTGWRVHPNKLEETRRILKDEVAQLQRAINLHALIPLGKFTNTTEAALLYDELGLTTSDGSRSVDREHLEEMDHPAADLICDMRDAIGCITKFLNPFEKFMVRRGREYVVFPNFRQSGARTFRFSATRPPIQTIPDASKSKSNMSARQCIGPRIGSCWYMIDYASLQVRIFADLAQDETMLTALRDGVKPHAAAARMAWNGAQNSAGKRIISETVALSDFATEVFAWCDSNKLLDLLEKHDYLQIGESLLEAANYDIIDAEKLIGAKVSYAKAKTLFFALIFGAGAKLIRKGLKSSIQETRRTIIEYKNAMPSLTRFSQEMIAFAQKHGYIETPYGDIIHTDFGYEYRAVAYVVQGTEAGFVKDRMLAIKEQEILPVTWRLLGQIHDELGFQAPSKNFRSHRPILRRIKDCMEDHTGHFGIEMPCEIDLVKTYWNEREGVEV